MTGSPRRTPGYGAYASAVADPSPGLAALDALLAELREDGNALAVHSGGTTDPITRLEPARPGALAVSWIVSGDEVVLCAGHEGGVWELEVGEPADIAFLRDVVSSVAAGRVSEALGWRRPCATPWTSAGNYPASTPTTSPASSSSCPPPAEPAGRSLHRRGARRACRTVLGRHALATGTLRPGGTVTRAR